VRQESGLCCELQHIPCHNLGLWTVWDPFSKWEIKKLIKAHKPEIVQTYMGRATRQTHIEKLSGVIHVARLCGNYDVQPFLHADAWVACTRWVADYMVGGGIPARKIELIPNFFSSSHTNVVQIDGGTLNQYGLEENDIVIVALGRLVSVKAIDVLIDAFAKLPGEIDGRILQLVIAGDGPERKKLEAQAVSYGIRDRIHFLGWVKDPGGILDRANLITFVSHEPEGFGNTILEAWASMSPLVITISRGAREVTEHGKTAWQVPCNDSVALAAGIEEVLKNEGLRSEMIRNGQAVLERKFSKKVVIQLYNDFYSRLLGI